MVAAGGIAAVAIAGRTFDRRFNEALAMVANQHALTLERKCEITVHTALTNASAGRAEQVVSRISRRHDGSTTSFAEYRKTYHGGDGRGWETHTFGFAPINIGLPPGRIVLKRNGPNVEVEIQGPGRTVMDVVRTDRLVGWITDLATRRTSVGLSFDSSWATMSIGTDRASPTALPGLLDDVEAFANELRAACNR
jgi:hypothetical protein